MVFPNRANLQPIKRSAGSRPLGNLKHGSSDFDHSIAKGCRAALNWGAGLRRRARVLQRRNCATPIGTSKRPLEASALLLCF